MSRVFNFSAGPAALPESVLRQGGRGDARLAWLGHVRDGDEPSRQGVHRHPCRSRAAAARTAGRARQLQGAVPAGRRHRRERDRADEHAARPDLGRLRRHRRVVEEVDQGGAASTRRSTSPPAARPAATPASRRATAGRSTRTPPTSTSAATRRSAASSTTGRPTPATCRWSPTCRATSCPGRWTCRSTASSTAGRRRTSARPG